MNLKIATLKWLSVAVFTAVFATSAMADDDVSISAGVRLWNNQWQANSFPLTQAGVTVASHADSGSTLATIPVVSLRYKDFGLSASQFIEKSYTLSDGAGSADNKRSETDVNLSYALIPGLSASIGWKQVKWSDVEITGPTLALSGNAPISSGFGIYGTGGIGWLDAKAANFQTLKADYALGEFGLTYSFDTNSNVLKGLTATMGYRFQKITGKNAPFANNRDVNDITSGMTFGLIGRF